MITIAVLGGNGWCLSRVFRESAPRTAWHSSPSLICVIINLRQCPQNSCAWLWSPRRTARRLVSVGRRILSNISGFRLWLIFCLCLLYVFATVVQIEAQDYPIDLSPLRLVRRLCEVNLIILVILLLHLSSFAHVPFFLSLISFNGKLSQTDSMSSEYSTPTEPFSDKVPTVSSHRSNANQYSDLEVARPRPPHDREGLENLKFPLRHQANVVELPERCDQFSDSCDEKVYHPIGGDLL